MGLALVDQWLCSYRSVKAHSQWVPTGLLVSFTFGLGGEANRAACIQVRQSKLLLVGSTLGQGARPVTFLAKRERDFISVCLTVFTDTAFAT